MACGRRAYRGAFLLAGLLACAAAGPGARAGDKGDDLAGELPRIQPLGPKAALETFQIHEGFRLEPIAVEPVVASPVSVCYDADGRLYVVEMRGYPFPEKGKPTGAVVLLEDRDGDGRYESRTEFLDGLNWPDGIVPYDGGVFVAAAPDIIYAKDTDGDGKADVRRAMFTGFGSDNVQALLNGLLWGPDGWIYGVTSANGGTIQNLARPGDKPVSVRGRDFRFKPDGSAFEAISGGGQFGHSFDDWGHRFTCNNSNHARQIVLPARELERNKALVPPAVILDIPVEGAAAPVFRISPPEPWRVVRTRQRAADPVMARRLPATELVVTGFFTSATGITVYRGTAYPEAYRGNLFIGDVGGNLVHRKTLHVHGAVFDARRADQGVEFIASKDNWFRPVNFTNTPNGTLLVIDMYRETIEHPWSIPEPIQRHLDLTSGKDRGRLYELVHKDKDKAPARRRSPRLSKAPSSELVKRLADPDAWWRETAQRLLVERDDRSVVPLLKTMAAERPSALGRMHALWTLHCLGALDADTAALGLADAEPRVREQSARICAGLLAKSPALQTKLIGLANDPDPMVRFQVAFRLGDIASDPRALQALAAIARVDASSPWTRTAVLSSIAGRSTGLMNELARQPGFFSSAAGGVWLDQLAYLVGAEHDADKIRGLTEHLESSRLGPETLMRVVLALSSGLKRAGASLPALIDQKGRFAHRVAELRTEAAEITTTSGSPDLNRRRVAIRFLAAESPSKARELLPTLLDVHEPAAVQLAALQSLGGVLDPAAAGRVIERWKSMSPAVRREAAEILFSRREPLRALLNAIDARKVPAAEIDPGRLAALKSYPDKDIQKRAAKILAAVVPAHGRAEVVATFLPALKLHGDREKGRQVFQKTCATCHRAEGNGHDVGPDLATVVGRSPEDLLMHVLDPNREVAPNYVNYSVATEDGRVLSGIIAEESAAALVLKRAEGATDTVPRDEIETIVSTGASLMPEGLEKGLAPQDFADLIAFLQSIRPSGAASR